MTSLRSRHAVYARWAATGAIADIVGWLLSVAVVTGLSRVDSTVFTVTLVLRLAGDLLSIRLRAATAVMTVARTIGAASLIVSFIGGGGALQVIPAVVLLFAACCGVMGLLVAGRSGRFEPR